MLRFRPLTLTRLARFAAHLDLSEKQSSIKFMIHTDEFWEEKEETIALRKVLNCPGLRRFRCVEVPNNVQLFHLDIVERSSRGDVWNRFIYDDIRYILPILAGRSPKDCVLSMQTRQLERENYRILRVVRIFKGVISPGFENYAFKCDDGFRYYESRADLSLGEFREVRILWSENS